MKAIILGGGYGTRLYPLTFNKAKPLLEVAGRPIVDYILDKIKPIKEIDQVLVVTNARFKASFENWAKKKNFVRPIKVISDGTLTNETRLGAVGDMHLVVTSQHIKDDVLVVGGDNLFDLKLTDFVAFAQEKKGNAVAARIVKDSLLIRRYGVISLDGEEKVLDFEEKPARPKSNLACICIYFFPEEKLGLLDEYIRSGLNKDAPGHYIAWLVKNDIVYGFKFEGRWFDIGDRDSYRLADRTYKERSR